MIVFTGIKSTNTYFAIIKVPSTPSPYTPTSTSIYYNSNLNFKLRGVFIANETSIKVLLYQSRESYVATLKFS
jgi:hypothetical protein